MNTLAQKEALRETLKNQREGLEEKEVVHRSNQIHKKILNLHSWSLFKKVALYASIKNEVITQALFDPLQKQGIDLFFPKVECNEMTFHLVAHQTELKRGAFGILEPTLEKRISPEELCVVIVPGLGFDRHGNRLGWGRGYYDRILLGTKGLKIALAYQFQILEEIPHHDTDIKVDLIVTEKEVISCKG